MKKSKPQKASIVVTGAAMVASLITVGQSIPDTHPVKGKIEAGSRIQHGGVWGGG